MTNSTNNKKTSHAKTFKGVVVSDRMKDTVIVRVDRYVKHPKYGKYMKRAKRYHAHDPGNTSHVGETVFIQETRPISRHKHFVIVRG